VDANALLAEIMRRSDFIFAGWNILMVAGLGLIVTVGLAPSLRNDHHVCRLLAGGFAFFALTHLLGMLHVTKQWASLTEALRLKLASEPTLIEQLEFAVMAPHLSWIVPFHLLFDASVVAAVLWLTRRKN
jgi:hypothetical protein